MALPPTPANRLIAGSTGFIAGVVVQVLFALLVDAIIGPAPEFSSPRLLLWAVILIIPPVLTGRYLRLAPGSLMLDFIRGVQAGVLFWFIAVLVRILSL